MLIWPVSIAALDLGNKQFHPAGDLLSPTIVLQLPRQYIYERGKEEQPKTFGGPRPLVLLQVGCSQNSSRVDKIVKGKVDVMDKPF